LSDSTLQGAGDDAAARAEPARTGSSAPATQRRGVGRPEPLYPQLRARRNASREAVGAHQRARLHAAMIEVVAECGYAATTVRHLRGLAGVSERTVYEHFESKEAYFLATYDLVVRQAVERISAAYRGTRGDEHDWAAGLCRAFDAFVEELVERPKSSQLALVEVLAVGPAALERIECAEAVFARMIAQSLAQGPGDVALPPLLVRSIVGGIWLVSRNRLLEGRPAAISSSGRELAQWMLAYCAPGAGSLACTTAEWAPPRAGVLEAPADVEGGERTRMLRAAARIAAKGGYLGLTPGQITELAGVSPEAFSTAFDGVGECFLASLELLSAQALARALRESEGAPDWPAAVCRAIHALLCQVAEDRVFARAAFVEVFAAGPAGIERRAALIRSFAALLARRVPLERRPSPLVAEAIVGAVWSIAHRHVARDRAHLLPSLSSHAAYLALAPIIGAEEAIEAILAELADGEGGGKRPEARSAVRPRTTALA
jgi:AcrR family transcriptional regulator